LSIIDWNTFKSNFECSALPKYVAGLFNIIPSSIFNSNFYTSKAVSNKHQYLEYVRIKKFDPSIDNLTSNLEARKSIIQKRSVEYLNWRYFENPNSDYNIAILIGNNTTIGYIVTSVIEYMGIKMIAIVDIVFDSTFKPYDCMMWFLKRHIHEIISNYKGISAVGFIHKGNSFESGFVRKLRFIKVPNAINPKKFHLIVRSNRKPIESAKQNIFNARDFFITWGDTDVI
jgi:hypothetical protein